MEFQGKLLRQLTRIADGIEAQNSLYERLLPPESDTEATNERQTDDLEFGYLGNGNLTVNCNKCEEDRCQPFTVKPIWLNDEQGNEVLQHCKCTCTCHMEKEIVI
tara:strand:- start:136 stop:450 length:315 start_codon:yes stop_codon:yes gene_type:complete